MLYTISLVEVVYGPVTGGVFPPEVPVMVPVIAREALY